MPWYKSGTVSVTQNSNAVIGAGTAFLSNARVGDAFRGPDGGWYEVTNIASDTAMSISPNYQGATNAAGVYALAPMQGYVKDSADALRSLVNQYGAKLAALGTTGNYDILPVTKGGTGGTDQAGARSGIGAAKSGANSDITSLAGLTTALSVTQGGTGVGTTAALLAALQAAGAYGKSNAVGTVSQTGGVPTGAIIETGTSAAGRYIRHLDGTLECWSYPGSIDQTVANTAYSTTFGLPATFVGSYAVFVNISSVNVSNTFSGYSRASILTGATYSIVQCWNVVQTYTYSIYAIGRWY
jgi:hypothetical protein